MKKAVAIGNLVVGDNRIPVKVYLGAEKIGLAGGLYHTDCDGKIGMYAYCTLCGVENPSVYSAIRVDEHLVKITTEDRDAIFDRKFAQFKMVSTHRLTELPALLASRELSPIRSYEIKPFLANKYMTDPEIHFATLMSRLAIKRRFMLVELPLDGMKRLCVLMATSERSGMILSLHYMEELRPLDILTQNPSRSLAVVYDQIIDENAGQFPPIFATKITRKITAFFRAKVQQISEQISGEKVNA